MMETAEIHEFRGRATAQIAYSFPFGGSLESKSDIATYAARGFAEK